MKKITLDHLATDNNAKKVAYAKSEGRFQKIVDDYQVKLKGKDFSKDAIIERLKALKRQVLNRMTALSDNKLKSIADYTFLAAYYKEQIAHLTEASFSTIAEKKIATDLKKSKSGMVTAEQEKVISSYHYAWAKEQTAQINEVKELLISVGAIEGKTSLPTAAEKEVMQEVERKTA